jgi:hypothetical protein
MKVHEQYFNEQANWLRRNSFDLCSQDAASILGWERDFLD